MLPTSSKSTALLLSILPLLPVFAEELAQKDVPPACTAICGPMVTLTNICDINPSGSGTNGTRSGSENSESDEPIEAACICGNTSFDVKKVAALCAACLTQNRGKGADGTWFWLSSLSQVGRRADKALRRHGRYHEPVHLCVDDVCPCCYERGCGRHGRGDQACHYWARCRRGGDGNRSGRRWGWNRQDIFGEWSRCYWDVGRNEALADGAGDVGVGFHCAGDCCGRWCWSCHAVMKRRDLYRLRPEQPKVLRYVFSRKISLALPRISKHGCCPEEIKGGRCHAT